MNIYLENLIILLVVLIVAAISLDLYVDHSNRSNLRSFKINDTFFESQIPSIFVYGRSSDADLRITVIEGLPFGDSNFNWSTWTNYSVSLNTKNCKPTYNQDWVMYDCQVKVKS